MVVRRNVYKLMQCPESFLSIDDDAATEALVYGQKLLIRGCDDDCYLAALPSTRGSVSRVSHQPVPFFSRDLTYDCIWRVQPIDPDLWIEHRGNPILKCVI